MERPTCRSRRVLIQTARVFPDCKRQPAHLNIGDGAVIAGACVITASVAEPAFIKAAVAASAQGPLGVGGSPGQGSWAKGYPINVLGQNQMPKVTAETGWHTTNTPSVSDDMRGRLLTDVYLQAYKQGWV